ncbi:MAG: NAD(P)/FAD-dependent oxidoreductase [Candidatus Nomurabacteria bacterium]|jgi:pyruvate/2-oxoglutarate dehydrogenase complex dihydrolipoamide dehydrogenase (E3) component|nr:NAD(P)/FAD-dependent oxidoreductase [Candidatus Nomurabacteria bacterium]
MSKFEYDLAVLGSGPAGATAASVAAKAGRKVAIMEVGAQGGDFLNGYDVPSQAAFTIAKSFYEAKKGAKWGLSSGSLRYNFPTLINFTRSAVRKASPFFGAKFLESAGVEVIKGRAHFLSPHEVSVGSRVVKAKNFVIATGAELKNGEIKNLENVRVLTPKSAFEIIRPPKSLFVIGAGATGVELAQYFATLGTQVLLSDIAARPLPKEDEEVGQFVDELFNKRFGIKVLTRTRVVAVEKDAISKKVILIRGGQEKTVRVDEVLLATSKAPATDIGLENAGVKYDNHGILVDQALRTTAKNIFAAGDVLGGNSSATRAVLEGKTAAQNLVYRSKVAVDLAGMPTITNILPKIASVGLKEDDCLKADKKIKKALVAFSDVVQSVTADDVNGFVKIIADRSGKLLGGTIMAPDADLMVAELSLAIKNGMSAEELAAAPHAVESWSEAVRVAGLRL